MQKLHIFTLVFGGAYVSYWKRAGAASLLWPRNLAALNSVEVLWDIYTHQGSELEVREAAGFLPIGDTDKVDITIVPPEKDAALRPALEKAWKAHAYFMPAPPDLIWGDGSIASLLKLMPFAYGRCLAVPHVRVAAGRFMDGFTGEPMTNAQLVKRSFSTLHESFVGAEVPSLTQNTHTTGVVWTRLAENLYAAGFFLPTIHMMQPTEDDVKWFKGTPGPDHWDHRWPAVLVGTDRHRIIASSDAAFMAELTEDESVHPRRHPTEKGKWDQYAGKLAHHVQNRNTVVIMRGE
jgi:hypothetical protein